MFQSKMIARYSVFRCVLVSFATIFGGTNAFQTVKFGNAPISRVISLTKLQAEAAEDSDIEAYLNERYPAFMAVLSRNEKACKVLRESGDTGFTVFAPNEQAFLDMGEKKCAQLGDPRNAETAEKIGAYHVMNEPVSADELYNSGGVITMGGEIPIDRSVSGGFFGVGGKEDGGVTVNGAKVISSVEIGSGIVHEVDAMISPKLLWRYFDQLRIPGSS
jgi:uncharacterized surface protein with fasciclin (FAS1) repeats